MSIQFTQSCIRCKQKGSKNWCCPHYFNCPYFENNYNTIINKYKDHIEVVVYKYEFEIFGNPNLSDVDRSRKFEYNDKGVLVSKSGDFSLSDLMDTLKSSRKRTLDNIYGYALSNDWTYFVTLTFDPNKIKDRTDRDCVLYAWELFRKKMQYLFKDIKLFFVLERHKLGGIHFHGFIGNADLTNYMVQAIDTKKYLYDYDYNNRSKVYKLDKNGNKLLNRHYLQPMTNTYIEKDTNIKHTVPVNIFKTDFFKYGYATIVKLEEGTKNEHITSYLTKYISKDQSSSIQYNKKAYFHTHNVDFKEKTVVKLAEKDVAKLVNGATVRKDDPKLPYSVYTLTMDEMLKNEGYVYDPLTDPDKIFYTFKQVSIEDVF